MIKRRMPGLGIATGLIASLLFLGSCVPGEVPEQEGGFDWTVIIFLVLIFALFYFIFIRPQRKRQKEHQGMVQELKRGDRVVTAGGIYGRVESISDDSVVIKVESEATIRVAKNSVALKRSQ